MSEDDSDIGSNEEEENGNEEKEEEENEQNDDSGKEKEKENENDDSDSDSDGDSDSNSDSGDGSGNGNDDGNGSGDENEEKEGDNEDEEEKEEKGQKEEKEDESNSGNEDENGGGNEDSENGGNNEKEENENSNNDSKNNEEEKETEKENNEESNKTQKVKDKDKNKDKNKANKIKETKSKKSDTIKSISKKSGSKKSIAIKSISIKSESKKSKLESKRENKNLNQKKQKDNSNNKKTLSEIFSLNKSKDYTDTSLSFLSKKENKANEMEILKRKMKNLEDKTKKLEKINNIFYEMIQKQNLEIDTQNNKYELEKLNNRFLLRNQEPRSYNNINTNLPLLQSHNLSNNKFNQDLCPYYNQQPYIYNFQPLQLPYINEMERILNNIKLENEGYKKIRENDKHIMRRIDEKINDFLLEETLKNNDNKYLRNQLQEMNDQINYRLESIEQNQRSQKQKIDYIMKNYFRNEKYYLKKHSRISEDENDERSKNFIGKTNLNKSGLDIHPNYYKLKDERCYDNKSSKKNRIYPYENSRRIFYEKESNNEKAENGMRKSSSMSRIDS